MATKPNLKAPNQTTTGVELMIEPFRVTVKKIRGGFTAQFDGIKDGKPVPVTVSLKFPKWWAEQLMKKLDKVR